MNKYKLPGLVVACALTISLPAVAQAALTIDDFNVATASSVSDSSVGGSESAPSVIDGANIVMNGAAGWARTLTAELTAGHNAETIVCSNCQAGHINLLSGSTGIGTYTYSGSPIDLSSHTSLGFDWGADLSGSSVDILFSDGANTATVASWPSLPATGGSAPTDLVTQTPMAIAWGAVNSSAITQIQFVVTGVADLDSIIDNFTTVPDPSAIPTMSTYGLVLTVLGMMLVANRRLRANFTPG